MLDQPLAPPLLAGRQLVAPALVGILARLERQSYRRAPQFKRFAEPIDQVTPVRLRDAFRLVAMNHDYGGVAAALVGVT